MKRLFISLLITSVFSITPLYPQSFQPEVLDTGTVVEQMEYLSKRTSIYNDFRAVREDIFQKIKKNTLDSMLASKKEIQELNTQKYYINASKDSVANELRITRDELETAINARESLFLFGISMNKTIYNTIMWALVGGLIFVSVIVLILFQRNRIITNQTRTELTELKEEFDIYRHSNREKIEQMVINHFNEIKKIKGDR